MRKASNTDRSAASVTSLDHRKTSRNRDTRSRASLTVGVEEEDLARAAVGLRLLEQLGPARLEPGHEAVVVGDGEGQVVAPGQLRRRRALGAGPHRDGGRGRVPLDEVERDVGGAREAEPGDLEARVGRGRHALEPQHGLVEGREAGYVGGLPRDVVELQRRHRRRGGREACGLGSGAAGEEASGSSGLVEL